MDRRGCSEKEKEEEEEEEEEEKEEGEEEERDAWSIRYDGLDWIHRAAAHSANSWPTGCALCADKTSV